jgi:hypothetical protein
MWPFRPRSILEPPEEEWQVETWKWLLEEKGGIEDLNRAPLVMPTREFFPPTDLKGHARAEHVFEAVKQIVGMSEWPCRLVPQHDHGELTVNPITALKVVRGAPAGTYRRDGNAAEITYDPRLIDDPWALVATLAHELSHYYLDNYRAMPPGGPYKMEPTTDLGVVYLGFGLFAANTAFRFTQHQDFQSQGWQYRRLGYLKEREWVFALAIFLSLRGIDTQAATSYLKPHMVSQLKRTLRYLAANPTILTQIGATGSFAPSDQS